MLPGNSVVITDSSVSDTNFHTCRYCRHFVSEAQVVLHTYTTCALDTGYAPSPAEKLSLVPIRMQAKTSPQPSTPHIRTSGFSRRKG